jgi:hypothetical protein
MRLNAVRFAEHCTTLRGKTSVAGKVRSRPPAAVALRAEAAPCRHRGRLNPAGTRNSGGPPGAQLPPAARRMPLPIDAASPENLFLCNKEFRRVPDGFPEVGSIVVWYSHKHCAMLHAGKRPTHSQAGAKRGMARSAVLAPGRLYLSG